MNQELVNEIVFSVCGKHPLELRKMTYGEMNTVYEVKLPNRELIFRANEYRQALEGTAYNIEVLSQLGIPVPKVIHSDVSKEQYPFAYILLEKIYGTDLRFVLPEMSKEQISELARKIVSIQRKVSTLPLGEGYGFAYIHNKADSTTWVEYMDWEIQGGLPEIEDVVGRNGIEQIKDKSLQLQDYFEQVQPVCFLDDITIKNVIMLNRKFQGIIDLDWVCYGDSLNMIALTQATIIADLGEEFLFYVEELCRYWGITSDQKQIIDFYSLVHSMSLIRVRRNNQLTNSVRRLEKAIKEWVENI